MRSSLSGPFVVALIRAQGQSMRWAAAKAGVSHTALGERLRGQGVGVSLERLLDVARRAHATPEQLALVADLDALDRGALPLDEQTTPEELRAARAAILAQRDAT